MKLNLGCGTRKLEGWVNVDSVASFQPDLLHDISLPFPYNDESVDEILAESLLEHFDKYLRFIVFYEWVRILKTGGIITIVVPDFHKILRRYFKFDFNTFLDNIFGEVMFESEKYIGHFGAHKWGYSEKALKEFIHRFGLEVVKIDKKNLYITLVARKDRRIDQVTIDKIKIYSSANDKGVGRDSISVEEARSRIKQFNKSNPLTS